MSQTKINSHDEYYDQRFNRLCYSEFEFEGVTFEVCEFVDCDFSQSTFLNCTFNECKFVNCNLSLVNLPASRLFDVIFSESKLVGIDFTKVDWPTFHVDFELQFSRSILNGISMFGLTLNRLIFAECKVIDADFREGNFVDSNWKGCDFSNSLFMNTNLKNVDLSESCYYDINVLNNQVENAVFSRFEALNLLESLGVKLVD
ncbi:pentapeptide repeat-containing protein [Vibrio sp. WJH972]